MSLVVVDVESDGPIPNKYSMVCFGAVVVDETLTKTFYGKTKPISDIWNPKALSISGISREEHLTFDEPYEVMVNFKNWLKENSKGSPVFISDNLAYDWQFINYYFHYYLNENPFGFSERRIGDLYCGMVKNGFSKWKHLRETKHDHNPVNDAIGNAEVILKIKKNGIEIMKKDIYNELTEDELDIIHDADISFGKILALNEALSIVEKSLGKVHPTTIELRKLLNKEQSNQIKYPEKFIHYLIKNTELYKNGLQFNG